MAAKKSASAAKKPAKGKVAPAVSAAAKKKAVSQPAPAKKVAPVKAKAPATVAKHSAAVAARPTTVAKRPAPAALVGKGDSAAPRSAPAAKAAPVAAPAAKKSFLGDFIGTFPIRKNSGEKKLENKKLPIGPVFPRGDYRVGVRETPLGEVYLHEFQATFLGKHIDDKLDHSRFKPAADTDPLAQMRTSRSYSFFSRELIEGLSSKAIDVGLLSMKDVPLDLPDGILLAAALKREDPRDALITRSTYGAVQELPSNARVGTSSKRRIMQIRNLRPDIEIVPLVGDVPERMDKLDAENLDAVFCAWATLRRLNISPRFYVALQPEQMTPAACQGGVGILCREDDKDLIAKLRYVEDSEASWSARCERAFLAKLGSTRDIPVGVYAHRKGTQDPWILDAIVGDPGSGEVLKHREIGTSRCKPESLADKAFMGILAKGARKFLPFG